MAIRMLRPDQLTTYWEKNPRKKSQQVIDGLYQNMLEHGFNDAYPLAVFEFSNRYHLSDGHHRYEAARQAGLSEVPCDVRDGDADAHLESLMLDNMKFDVALGNIGQMLKPKEKRAAVEQLILLPKYWMRTDVWLGDEFRTTSQTISNYRKTQGFKILNPSNPLNLSEKRIAELEALILKNERIDPNGDWIPVKQSKLKAELERIIEHRKRELPIDADAAMLNFMLDAGRPALEEMPALSVEETLTFRRIALKLVHPDKIDTSGMADEDEDVQEKIRSALTCLFMQVDAQTEEQLNQAERRADLAVTQGETSDD